jgi:hypothetical protein
MSAINWASILTALQDLFQAGSGLADTRVLFVRNGHRTERPDTTDAWISLAFESSTPIGRAYTVEEEDEDGEAGAEIVERTITHTRVAFKATAFPRENEEDATTSYALLNEVIAEAATPARKRALKAAGIGQLKFEQTLRLDSTMGARIEPRATMLMIFTVAGEKLTTNGYIETVNTELLHQDSEALITSFSTDLSDE